jgi:hypothetical protein
VKNSRGQKPSGKSCGRGSGTAGRPQQRVLAGQRGAQTDRLFHRLLHHAQGGHGLGVLQKPCRTLVNHGASTAALDQSKGLAYVYTPLYTFLPSQPASTYCTWAARRWHKRGYITGSQEKDVKKSMRRIDEEKGREACGGSAVLADTRSCWQALLHVRVGMPGGWRALSSAVQRGRRAGAHQQRAGPVLGVPGLQRQHAHDGQARVQTCGRPAAAVRRLCGPAPDRPLTWPRGWRPQAGPAAALKHSTRPRSAACLCRAACGRARAVRARAMGRTERC